MLILASIQVVHLLRLLIAGYYMVKQTFVHSKVVHLPLAGYLRVRHTGALVFIIATVRKCKNMFCIFAQTFHYLFFFFGFCFSFFNYIFLRLGYFWLDGICWLAVLRLHSRCNAWSLAEFRSLCSCWRHLFSWRCHRDDPSSSRGSLSTVCQANLDLVIAATISACVCALCVYASRGV